MSQVIAEATHPGWYLALTFAFALVPLVLGTATSYLKVSLALGVLRNGFGAQQVPNNTIIMVLALVLSLFIMQPTIDQIVNNVSNLSTQQWSQIPTIDQAKEYAEAFSPWRDFLIRHAGTRELEVLRAISETVDHNSPANPQLGADTNPALRILLPAFVLTELREGLMMGFVLLLPFLVVDLVVANILAGLGMYMMSPTIISLPLKLLLFVSVDGWLLISRGFIASYAGIP